MRTSPSGITVIGVGSAYRSDDAVGLIVAQRLKQRRVEGVTVLEESGEGAALMDAWKEADAVILIDAVHSGAEPGTIHCLDARDRSFSVGIFHSSTHAFGVAEAIELARALGQLPQHFIVYGVEGKTFTAGVGLSAEVERASEQVAARVLGYLRENLPIDSSEAEN